MLLSYSYGLVLAGTEEMRGLEGGGKKEIEDNGKKLVRLHDKEELEVASGKVKERAARAHKAKENRENGKRWNNGLKYITQ